MLKFNDFVNVGINFKIESGNRDHKEYQKDEDDDDDDDDEAKAKSDLAKAQEEALFDEEIRLRASLSRMGDLGDDEEFEKSLMSALDKIPEEVI